MLTAVRVLLSRVHAIFTGTRLDVDFDQEAAAHIAMLTEEHVGRGMPVDAARRAAVVRFGGLMQIKEQQRHGRGVPLLETTQQDLRYAGRTLRRSPGFTALAVLTLGLGIGVNTTVFTLFDAVAFRGLPVSEPDTLVRLERSFTDGSRGDIQYAFSYAEYQAYFTQAHALTGVVAASWPVPVAYDSGRLEGQLVSGTYFSSLGARAALGRLLVEEDERARQPVVVLSTSCWRERFASDANIAGRSIRINDASFTIAGVASAEFIGTGNPPRVPDFWAPLGAQPLIIPAADWLQNAAVRRFQLLARMDRARTRASVQAELTALAAALDTESGGLRTLSVTPEHATLFGGTDDPRFRAFAVVVMTIVGLVLLIACANISNMLFARMETRRRELAIRLAIGASRARVARQLLTETAVLSLLGGAAGLVFSVWGCRWLWASTAAAVQSATHAETSVDLSLNPDMTVFAYTVAMSLVAGFVVGLWPALRSSGASVTSALKDEPMLLGRYVSRSRLRALLIAGQVAGSLALLVMAGLLARGALAAQDADPGFPAASIYAVTFDRGEDPGRAWQVQSSILDRLRSLKDLAGVSLVQRVPQRGTWTIPIADADAPERRHDSLANYVSAGYFRTMNLAIERGRDFEPQEKDDVAIVSMATARTLWPSADPIGRHLRLSASHSGGGGSRDAVVIGVVRDVRTANASRTDPMYVYLPTGEADLNEILIRTGSDADAALTAVRSAVSSVDRSVMSSLEFVSLDALLRSQRLVTSTMAGFIAVLAVLALLLASSGIYGVMNVLVAQRFHEIGVRVALGAGQFDVIRLVLVDGLRPVAIGAAAGLALASAGSAVARAILVAPSSPDLLYGVGAFDPVTFLTIGLVLAVSAIAAAGVPAWRATLVDPMIALRVD